MDKTNQTGPERRRHPRVKAKIPVELHLPSQPAMRTATEEVSLCGCYIETMFTMDVGTMLELVFSLQSGTLIVHGVVATKYPQVGNGIEFLDLAPQDRQMLSEFLAHCDPDSEPGSAKP